MNEDGYLTTADALLYLRTTQRTLYRLLASGKIPAVRIGRQWRFRKTDLDRWTGQQSRSRSADQRAALGTTTPARKRRVLIVDAEPSVRQTLTSIFAASEYDVEAVPDGLGAIARLRMDRFDLVTTDLRLRGVEGIQLAREAKRLWRGIKVVIITAHPSQSSAIEAVNIGVDGYLTKPFRPMDVLLATARAFEAGSAAAAAEPTSTVTADTRSC